MKKLTLSCSLVGLIVLAPAHAAQRTATDESLTAVIEMLRSPDPVVRTRGACTRKVFDANATAAIPALVRLLNDAEPVAPHVCRPDQRQWWGDERPITPGEEAARALVRIGRASLDSLMSIVREGGSEARRNSAWALGALDDERSVDALIAALRDQDEAVRERAAWALGAIGDERAAAGLAAALKDSDARVRRQAAWALGAMAR
jgi:HEAT repeat protein